MSICGYFKNNKLLVRDYNLANTYREKKKEKKRERKGENLVEVVNLGGDEREDTRSLRNALKVTELLQV